MRQNMVIANWKLNGGTELIAEFANQWDSLTANNVQVVVCPPAVYLAAAQAHPSLVLGAQSCSAYQEGAYTGELSAAMLHEVGARYVLVGHSERRAMFGETDEVVANKIAAAQQANLVPVLCVGETAEQRSAGFTAKIILQQLEQGLLQADLTRLVIAYEPVWAIGTGETASPAQAQEIHALIRNWVAQQDKGVAAKIPLLYGGSVKPENAAELFQQQDIDGGLIGGASLDVEQFKAICTAAQEI
ncbi:triose-phosphate isomerase [Aliidiomarina quisquiliarum]|uniref:triose-phosphate isomerase n=1 Tax=Aliidiomarina quisquiliarum TaxID=2938947 RepID=UPI00208FD7C5|nr:triose-phosphate isomerase [Aliidiomarina quisquiliarum]